MEPWQRFGRQRLAQSRWNCEPAAIAAVGLPAGTFLPSMVTEPDS